MTNLLISIDVEECFDVSWIAGALRDRGIPATFFLDVFACKGHAGASVSDAAAFLAGEGMDVQLHTHTGHLGIEHGMSGCAVDEQRRVISDGVGLLREWTGAAATWHRAGDLRADRNTLSACREEGMVGDSSFIYGWPQCAALGVERERRNNLQRIDGVLELPVSTFLTVPFSRNYRHYDLDACTLSELRVVAAKAVEAEQEFLVMLAHSTSIFRFDGTGYIPDAGKRDMMMRFLDAVRGMDGLEVSDYRAFRDSDEARTERAGSSDLCAGLVLTYGRAWSHFDRSIKHKVFALAPIVLCAAVVAWLVSDSGRQFLRIILP